MHKSDPPDPKILELGEPTQLQRKLLQAWIDEGSKRKAAKALNHPLSPFSTARSSVEKRAAEKGWTKGGDNSHLVPSGYYVRGTSTLIDSETGEEKLKWVKVDKEKEAYEQALKDFIEVLTDSVPPKKPERNIIKAYEENLMSGIFIGDSHFGMYATADETKHSDYDSDIATELMRDAIDDLVNRSPNSSIGLLVDVGDYMHSNSSHNKTFKGTPVDTDTRFSRVLRKAGQAMNHAVSRMLEKFPKVVVVIAKGNHNPDIAVCVQEIVKAYYRDEPRVTVLDTNGDFHYLAWGDWLIGINHGDKIRPERLVSCMARDMPKAWGRSKSRMWAVGHYHHQDVKEIDGCIVQKFAALPPPDGWHSSSGYGSAQAMQMIVFKKEGGRHSTLIYELPRPETEPDIVIE